jgi:hypothetical protein
MLQILLYTMKGRLIKTTATLGLKSPQGRKGWEERGRGMTTCYELPTHPYTMKAERL